MRPRNASLSSLRDSDNKDSLRPHSRSFGDAPKEMSKCCISDTASGSTKEECPTQANLPKSKDPSTESALSEEKLSTSEKLASPTSVKQFGNDVGDDGQNQSKECKRGHNACKYAEMQASSPMDKVAIQNCSIPKTTEATHKSPSNDEESNILAQKKKCYQESSEDTPINKKLPTINSDTTAYMRLWKQHRLVSNNQSRHTCTCSPTYTVVHIM